MGNVAFPATKPGLLSNRERNLWGNHSFSLDFFVGWVFAGGFVCLRGFSFDFFFSSVVLIWDAPLV